MYGLLYTIEAGIRPDWRPGIKFDESGPPMSENWPKRINDELKLSLIQSGDLVHTALTGNTLPSGSLP